MKYLFFLLLFSPLLWLQAQILPLHQPLQPKVPGGWENQQPWQAYQDLDGRFQIKLPANWQHTIDSVDTAVGTLAYHTFFLQPPVDTADNEVYMLSYVDYPAGSLHHDSSELVTELLDATLATAVERMKGEVLFSTEKPLGHYPGRYWRIDYLQGQASVRTHALVAYNRYYALQTISRSGKGINKSSDRFFDSFSIF